MATTTKKSKKPTEKPLKKSAPLAKETGKDPDDKTRMEKIAEAYGD